jgi:hypothetical protein
VFASLGRRGYDFVVGGIIFSLGGGAIFGVERTIFGAGHGFHHDDFFSFFLFF